MICPVCKTVELRIADKAGVEIDYCPQCRGIWLDRGELEKIIERSYISQAPQHYGGDGQYRGSHHDDDDDHYRESNHHRKKSWLAELFD